MVQRTGGGLYFALEIIGSCTTLQIKMRTVFPWQKSRPSISSHVYYRLLALRKKELIVPAFTRENTVCIDVVILKWMDETIATLLFSENGLLDISSFSFEQNYDIFQGEICFVLITNKERRQQQKKKQTVPNISPAYVVAQLTSFAKLESGMP